MSDFIKREDAIKAIHNYWKKRLDTLPTKESECGEVYADIQQMDKILEHNKTLCNFIKAIPSTDRPQAICEYGEYCMCATCNYQEDCSYCADCTEAKKQMHDIWTCTKYMRKEYLRKGSCDAPTIEIVVYGNCARCGKPIEGNSIFLCDECKSLMKGADNGADNI